MPLARAVRAVAALALAALAACATQAPVPADPALVQAKWRAQQAALSTITQFGLSGRAASGSGVKAELRWRQLGDGRFEVRVAGPFGAGAVAISGTPQAVEIRTKDGVEYTRDPEGWLQQRAGWTFPVRGLRWWALGLPAPDAPAQLELDDEGRLARLAQDGWTLHYSEYEDVQGYALPRRFEAASAAITLKLVVDGWDGLPARAGAVPGG